MGGCGWGQGVHYVRHTWNMGDDGTMGRIWRLALLVTSDSTSDNQNSFQNRLPPKT